MKNKRLAYNSDETDGVYYPRSRDWRDKNHQRLLNDILPTMSVESVFVNELNVLPVLKVPRAVPLEAELYGMQIDVYSQEPPGVVTEGCSVTTGIYEQLKIALREELTQLAEESGAASSIAIRVTYYVREVIEQPADVPKKKLVDA